MLSAFRVASAVLSIATAYRTLREVRSGPAVDIEIAAAALEKMIFRTQRRFLKAKWF